MKPEIQPINLAHSWQYATYEPTSSLFKRFRGTHDDLKVEAEILSGGMAGCNLSKLLQRMQGTVFGVEQMRAARRNHCTPGDIQTAFEAYCKMLKDIEYIYINHQSLFDREPFMQKPNCFGRAKGFLQLLAVCGVPLKDLALVLLGKDDQEEKKVIRREKSTVNYSNVFKPNNLPDDDFSPNAVTASLEMNGKLKVYRSTREPFKYHYCAMVSNRGRLKFWDPLFRRGYVNGMLDYFCTVQLQPDLNLPNRGPKCYVDPEDKRKRLYLFEPEHVLPTFADSSAYNQVRSANSENSKKNSVYLIIDVKHWSNRDIGKTHPTILKHVFKRDFFVGGLNR